MSSSDSDDDMYSNYVEKRKALVNRKKLAIPDSPESCSPQKEANSSSDDDIKVLDDDVVIKKTKKRKMYSDDDEDFDDFISPSIQPKKSHTQYLEDKKKQAAKEYASDIKTKSSSAFRREEEEARSTPFGSLARAYRLCDDLDDDDSCVQVASPSTPMNANNRSSRDSCSPMTSTSFPVTIDVSDMEVFSNGRSKFDVQLEDNFDDVRMTFSKRWGCPLGEVALRYKNDIVGEFETPKGLGLTALQIPHPRFDAYKLQTLVAASTADLNINSASAVNNADTTISLKVQSKLWKKAVDVKVEKKTTIKELRDIVWKMMTESGDKDILCDGGDNMVRLMFDDDYLTNDEETIESLAIENNDCIDVY